MFIHLRDCFHRYFGIIFSSSCCNMELELREPNKFDWKPLFTGSMSRNPTVTDVKFIGSTRIVTANRQDAKFYLIDISSEAVLSTTDSVFDGKYYHPDLFDIHDNLIYCTNYEGYVTVFELKDDIIVAKEVITIDPELRIHGIHYYGDHVWLTVAQGKKFIIKLNPRTKEHKRYVLRGNGDNSIKDIYFFDSSHVVVLTTTNTADHKSVYYDGFICLYRFMDDTFHFMDAIRIRNCQFDSIIVHDGKYYATAHTETRSGLILYGSVSKSRLEPYKSKSVAGFPHGIDIVGSKLAYTSYSKSAVYIMDIPS
jgi:hypothetical protein